MEEEISSPCKRGFGEFRDEESPERINTAQPATPSQDESKNLGCKSEKKEPRMIVLALFAPPQMKNKNPTMKNAKSKNLDPVTHRKEERRRQRLPFGATAAATTAVSVYKIAGLSCCCYCNLLPQNSGVELSGCAVISKGIVVVEGEISSIRRYLKFMLRRKEERSDTLKVIWQGKVARPSFGKFSILHCTSEVAVCKFFADHGASHYWDLAVKSNRN
ncbi:hypothetical protein Pfo_022084 [Paulownia fortunei]|nr:hypothetical protein Pfo_022084 [Paulownia fortunei]